MAKKKTAKKKTAKKAPRKAPRKKLSAHDRAMAKLQAPSRWPSFGRWQLAMEKKYGKHHRDWPTWGIEALATHVERDLKSITGG